MNLKRKIIDTTIRFLEKKNQKRCVACENRNMKNLNLEALTEEEKLQVKNLWGISDFSYHRMFKTMEGFDARYVSDYSFLPRVLRALNPMGMSRAFEEKSLYGIIYSAIPQPKSLVICNRGGYIIDNKYVSFRNAVDYLKTQKGFIIKPTHDSTQGNNVRYVRTSEDDVESILKLYGEHFITQEKIEQSSMTSVFNKSSLNSFRVSTLNINGKSSLCNIVFRSGLKGSVVDNLGAGGLMLGVSPDGQFFDYAYDNRYIRHDASAEGVRFSGYKVGKMKDIVDLTLKWHAEYLPHLGFAGWDVVLDEHDNPIMIEVNLRWPGIQFEQLCTKTPLFGDRTDEVVEFVKRHPLTLNDVMSI